MKTTLVILLMVVALTSCNSNAQESLEGIYYGQADGSNLKLELKLEGTGNYSGKLTDEYQTYVINAQATADCLEGSAFEEQLQINLKLSGCREADALAMKLDFSDLGIELVKDVRFSKQRQQSVRNSQESNFIEPSTTRDPQVAGVWKQEQLYNSGYGDNFFGGSFTQKVVFYPDGGVADGGSQATVSGGDYSGNSTSGNGAAVPGVSWSTKNKHLYITVSQNGQTQTIDAGKYYVDNDKMLITSENGSKTLLIKVY